MKYSGLLRNKKDEGNDFMEKKFERYLSIMLAAIILLCALKEFGTLWGLIIEGSLFIQWLIIKGITS